LGLALVVDLFLSMRMSLLLVLSFGVTRVIDFVLLPHVWLSSLGSIVVALGACPDSLDRDFRTSIREYVAFHGLVDRVVLHLWVLTTSHFCHRPFGEFGR
jgi:hypothetical protein